MTSYSYEHEPIEKIDVWATIQNQIERSLIKRYKWKLILGDSLTKIILRYKMQGATPSEAFDEIITNPIIEKIRIFYPQIYSDMKDKIKIGVCSRYTENETAIRLFNKEFKDKSQVEKTK